MDILTELQAVAVAEGASVLPYLAALFALHVAVEFAVPAIAPAAFDVLGLKDGIKDRRKLAKDARTKVVCTTFALLVATAAAVGLASASGLAADPYASTALTGVLMRAATAYFAWDLVVCAVDGYGIEWWIHGVCCLVVFTLSLVRRAGAGGGLGWGGAASTASLILRDLPQLRPFPTPHPQRPFLHYMGLVTLLFEASTPFLHVRKALIQAGGGSGRAFAVIQALFAATFVATRIVFGYWKCWAPGEWFSQMNALVEAGGAHSVAVVRLYQVNCFVLSALNGFWAWQILAAGRKRGGSGKKGE
jgi:hypothetical protein